MSTIFVSYRRDDATAATLLAQHIEHEGFDLFFDRSGTAIKEGERYAEKLGEGLAGARIVLVVIGREWASEKNLFRLSQEEDWVRREIAAGLARTGEVVVIPVLVDGAPLPPVARLPPALQPLLSIEAAVVSTHRFKDDAPRLVRRLRELLEGAGPRREREVMVPPLLPYLCDRVEQEDALASRLSSSPAPAAHVCVLHGFAREGHAQFLERALVARECLPTLLEARETGIARHTLELNRGELRLGRHREALTLALKRKLLGKPAAIEDELSSYLRFLRQPLVVSIMLTGAEVAPKPTGLLAALKSLGRGRSPAPSPVITGLTEAWRALFPAAPQRHMVLWINVAWERPNDELALTESHGALPPLRPIASADILEWLAQNEVRRFFSGREAAIHAIAERDDARRARLHMVDFSDEVSRLS